MSDSDDSPPVVRKVQPKPRPRPRKAARSDSIGSPTAPPSQSSFSSNNSASTSSPPQARQRIEDDFFSKARNYRNVFKDEVSKPDVAETKAAADKILDLEDYSLHASDPNVLPILDFEDEAREIKSTMDDDPGEISKRKREISLTPPPELPTRHIPVATSIPLPAAAAPFIYDIDDDDETQDNEELDPELAFIAAKLNSSQHRSVDSTPPLLSPSSSQSQTGSTSIPNSTTPGEARAGVAGVAGPDTPLTTPSEPVPIIQIMLRMIRHPLRVVLPEHEILMRNFERPLKVTVKASDSFRTMMTFYCEQKGVLLQMMVFTFRGTRLLPSSTPASLSLPPLSVVDVYETEAYKYIRKQEAIERNSLLVRSNTPPPSAPFAESSQPGQGDAGGAETGLSQLEDDSANYLFIKLRGLNTADEKLKVKSTTLVQSIVTHYKKIKALDPATVVRLEFDDEALDAGMSIGETEIEDDDMLVVRVG